MLKLIWTDIATNALVGTRGRHPATVAKLRRRSKRQEPTADEFAVTYPVYWYVRRIRYHWIYGIPAFFCLFVVGSAVILASISTTCGQASIDNLRGYLHHLSAGRILALHNFPETSQAISAKTLQWIQVVGHKQIDIFKYSAAAEQVELLEPRVKQRYVRVREGEAENVPLSPVRSRFGHLNISDDPIEIWRPSSVR